MPPVDYAGCRNDPLTGNTHRENVDLIEWIPLNDVQEWNHQDHPRSPWQGGTPCMHYSWEG